MPTPDNSRYAGLTKGAEIDPGLVNNAKSMANRKLWELLLMGGGLGLMSGSAFGAAKMFGQPKPPKPSPTYQSVDLMLPGPRKDEVKTAGGGATIVDRLSELTQPIVNATRNWKGPGGWFMGNKATNWWEVPALWTAGLPGALGLAYGGHKAMSGVMDHARQGELDEQLENTRKQYKQIVQESLARKQANDQTLEEELDDLADLHEKNAGSIEENMWHLPNMVGSAYLPYALISALASGKFSYDYFKKNSPQKIQEEALQRRAKERSGGVSPIYLEPTTKEPV